MFVSAHGRSVTTGCSLESEKLKIPDHIPEVGQESHLGVCSHVHYARKNEKTVI